MRNKKGQFVKGHRASKATEFKKGEHWRKKKPYWNREWLYNEYVVGQKSASEIASDWGVTQNAILFWLDKLNIKTRSMKEIRKIKHWGLSGEQNGMYGKRGPEASSWKGGVTKDRQKHYSSIEWKRVSNQVWKRDKGVCQRCGAVKMSDNDKYHIHHIVSFAVKKFRSKKSNLILLCEKCHKWVHSNKNKNKEFIKEV